jgi:hypothetical protein
MVSDDITGIASHGKSGSRVRERWQRIIASMLISRTDIEAAAHAGIHVRTLYRLKKYPEFQADLRSAKDAQFVSAIDCLRGNAVAFTDTLAGVAADKKQPGSARVRAAEVGLNTLLKATELDEILKRLQKLEAAANEERK